MTEVDAPVVSSPFNYPNDDEDFGYESSCIYHYVYTCLRHAKNRVSTIQ